MTLKDYSNSVIFRQLFNAMGITTLSPLPRVTFTRTITKTIHKTKIDDIDLANLKQLESTGIEIKISDITTPIDELLELRGRKVCIYIRDQRQNIYRHIKKSDYRYHLCNCKTLQMMREQGREHRYLATKRNDGYFSVNDLSGNKPQECTVKMELCKNCIDVLSQKRIYKAPFNLNDFFKKYDSDTPKTIPYAEIITEIHDYTPDFNDISREYKKAVQYTCSLCKVNCENNTSCLHLHHINGNKSDNSRHNLLVLCVDCHSNQPLHSHMKSNPEFIRNIHIIKQLRDSQKII